VRDDCKLECAVTFRCERRQLGYCEAFGGSLAGGPEGKQLGWRYTLAFGGHVGRSYGGEVYDGRWPEGTMIRMAGYSASDTSAHEAARTGQMNVVRLLQRWWNCGRRV
jgi:hypothetical protein